MNLITANGIEFYSEQPQAFFDRKRSKRLNKKLYTGEHLTLLVEFKSKHTIEEYNEILNHPDLQDFPDRDFAISDYIIDLSYVNIDRCMYHPDRFVGFVGEQLGYDQTVYENGSMWEVYAPNKSYFLNSVADIKHALHHIGLNSKEEGDIIHVNS